MGKTLTLLNLNEVDAGYGHLTVLRGVSMDVHEGEVVALMGSNGAGKSTLLMVLSRVIKESHGTITLDGQPVAHFSTADMVEQGVILVPEGRRIFPQFTVYENLIIGSQNRRARKKAKDNLKTVWQLFPRLEERRQQKGGTLSGGEQQMLALGRGLMADPRLLLLDEPSLGLAPLLVIDIFKVIKDIPRQGVTVVLVEQNMKAALALADRGYVLDNGKVVLSGKGQELRENEDIKKHYLAL